MPTRSAATRTAVVALLFAAGATQSLHAEGQAEDRIVRPSDWITQRQSGSVDLPRFPSISPDGNTVVFSWRGDLWSVPTEGGHATRLTSHPREETNSLWIPGKRGQPDRIAFNSDRDGYTNAYIMNADGTSLRQVTATDRTFRLSGVSPDGKKLLGYSSREGDVYRATRPYEVSIEGGPIQRVHDAFGSMPVMSDDGKLVAFERGGSDWDRRHYRGPDARDVWVYETKFNDFVQITDWAGNDGMPQFVGDNKIIFASDRTLETVNLYALELGRNSKPGNPLQLTSFEGLDVQSFDVSADGSTAVILVWDTLYSLDLTADNAKPQPLAITASEDERDNFELKSIINEVTEAKLSPDGKVMAVIAYGEVFIRATEDGAPTRRVTRNEPGNWGRHEGLAWSPDGMTLYFTSDADGTKSIYGATVALTRGEIKAGVAEKLGKTTAEETTETAPEPAAKPAPKKPAPKPEAPISESIVGQWNGSITGLEPLGAPEDSTSLTLSISTRGDGNLAGVLTVLGAQYDFTTITYEAGALRATLIVQGTEAVLEATLEDGTLSGDWTVPAMGLSGDWSASRMITTRSAPSLIQTRALSSFDSAAFDAHSGTFLDAEFGEPLETSHDAVQLAARTVEPTTPVSNDAAELADTIIGTWTGEYKGLTQLGAKQDTAQFTWVFTGRSSRVRGTWDAMGAAGDFDRIRFTERSGRFRASITHSDTLSTFTGVLRGNELSGTWQIPSMEAAGEWSATRDGVTTTPRTPQAAPTAPTPPTPPAPPAASSAPEAPQPADDSAEDSAEDGPDPTRWHDAVRFDITPVIQATTNDTEVIPSPDGRWLSFRRDIGNIWLYNIETGEEMPFLEHWDQWSDWRWSPDSQLIAYSVSDRDFNRDVFIAPIDGSFKPVNISMHPDNDLYPRWSADGKILVFTSERTNEEYDVYRVYLDRDIEGLTGPDLEAYYEDAVKAAKATKPLKPGEFGEPEPIIDDLELEDAYLRLRRMTSLPGSEGNLEITPGGDRIIFTGDADGVSLWSIDWQGRDRKQLGGSAAVQQIAADGSKLVLVRAGSAATVSPTGGGTEAVRVSDTIRIDLQAQNAQKFAEATRTLGGLFYHPDMKGLDWAELTDRYGRLAAQSRTSGEFDAIANRMLGELNASHLGVRGRDRVAAENAQSNGRLGVDLKELGDRAEVTLVLPGGPAADGEMALKVGDVITHIELEPLAPTTSVEQMLKGRTGTETIITVDRNIDGETTSLDLLITPTSYGAENNLRYEHWQRERARLVDEWSNGRIGYLHIRGMNQPSLDEYERDLFAAGYNRDALIVDVRNNGGGSTADRVMASLSTSPHAYTVPRGADPSMTTGYPQDRLYIQRYFKPVNMMCNEKSFSNAEIVSHAFKTLERGTLVGQQTYGGVISTGGFSLIDGTTVRLPFRGWYLLDGTDMENNGAMPDIVVPQTPEQEAKDIDAQLRAAVEDLMKRL